jgi:hypothetical protein
MVAAAELVVTTQYGSATMLQRTLQLQKDHAAAVLDRLAELGVIGPARGPATPPVLVRQEDVGTAVAAVRAGRRFAHPVDEVSADQRRAAERLVFSAIPEDLSDIQARRVAAQIVGLLVDSGWRATR